MAPLCLHGQPAAIHIARLHLHGSIPLVHVYIDHHGPYSFVVDTGTSNEAILSRSLASKLQLKAIGERQLADLQGGPKRLVQVVSLDSLEIAGVNFKNVSAIVNWLPGTGFPYDGIVGFGLFRDSLLTLDLPHRQLRLSAGGLSAGADPNVVSFRMKAGVPTVKLSFEDHPAEGVIDTGATALIIPAKLAQSLGLMRTVEVTAEERTQVGQFKGWYAKMTGDIDLATFQFVKPNVEVTSSLSMVDLGADTFRDFALTFDQRDHLVRFRSKSVKHKIRGPTRHQNLQVPAGVLRRTVEGTAYSGR